MEKEFQEREIITMTESDKPSKTSPPLTRIVDLPIQEFSICGIQTDILIGVANIQFGPHSNTRISHSHSDRNDQVSWVI
jgi:hypothetical protein